MIYLFNNFALSEENHILLMDENEIEVRPKTFQVLRYFVKNPGRLVTEEALVDYAWPELQGTDPAQTTTVGRTVSDLRAVLNDKPPSLITRNRVAKGYRFQAEVRKLFVRPQGPFGLPPFCNIPYVENPQFTGRDTLISTLQDRFESEEQINHLQSLTGLGGIGKTQIALHYAYWFSGDYRAILWVRAEHNALETSYRSLARTLSLSEVIDNDHYTQIQAIRTWLENNRRWLLIFDNAEEPETVKKLLPRVITGHVLITSRYPNWRGIATTIKIPELESQSAVSFMQTRTSQENPNVAQQIAEALGNLPLALEQAGAYIEKTGITFYQYLDQFNKYSQQLLDQRDLNTDYPHTVATTWEISFQHLENNPELSLSVNILQLCAFLSPDAIPEELLSGEENTPLEFDNAISHLLDYSLVRRENTRIYVHRLVQAVTRHRISQETQQHLIDTLINRILKNFEQLEGYQPDFSVHDTLLPHAMYITEYATDQPDTREHAHDELSLLLKLGPLLMVSKGYGSPDVLRIYQRAQVLCDQEQLTPHLFPALFGLWPFYHVRAEHHNAETQSQKIIELAMQIDEPDLLIEAHLIQGSTLCSLGRLTESHHHLSECSRLYIHEEHKDHTLKFGQDPGVMSRCHLSRVLWLLGYPSQALEISREACQFAEEGEYPINQTFAYFFASVLYSYRREAEQVQRYSAMALELGERHNFPQWIASAKVLHGWAFAMQNRKDGLDQIRQGIAMWQTVGARLAMPHMTMLLAEAIAHLMGPEGGLELQTEAMALIEQTEEHEWKAEIYRLKGEWLLQQSDENFSDANARFQDALEIAQQQQAKSLELRAAMSLSRLWQRQEKHAEARQLLGEVYGWFTEGFDTSDLQDAKRLLDNL